MKTITNVYSCPLSLIGIGTIAPGQSVEVSDELAASCLTAPIYWRAESEVKPEKLEASISTKLDIKKADE